LSQNQQGDAKMKEHDSDKELGDLQVEKAQRLLRGVFAVCMVLVVACVGAAAVRDITDERLDVEDLAWSPDGNHLAFSASSSGTHIYVINADGSHLRQVTDDNGSEPTWSPDGARIAFVSRHRICVTDVTGGQVDCLTDSTMRASTPAWSPVGDAIAFIVQGDVETDTAAATYVVGIDGSNLRHVVDISPRGTFGWPPAWSPDGSMIAYLGKYGEDAVIGTYIVDSDGSNVRRLVGDKYPTWSQDGTEVVFHGADEIYAVSVDEGTVRHVADVPGELDNCPAETGRFVWSPDMTRFAFTAKKV
jgi:Tol biopolymer transport system component